MVKVDLSQAYFHLPHSRRTQAISETQLQRPTSTNDVPSLRPFISATNVHILDELGSRVPEKTKYEVRGIPRRFFSSESVLSSFTRTHYIYVEPNEIPRLDYQYGQVLYWFRHNSWSFWVLHGTPNSTRSPCRNRSAKRYAKHFSVRCPEAVGPSDRPSPFWVDSTSPLL